MSKNEWIIHEDAHDAIVSKELFYEVRSVVDKKKEKKSFVAREDLPLTADRYKGILKCPVCGGDFRENLPLFIPGKGMCDCIITVADTILCLWRKGIRKL